LNLSGNDLPRRRVSPALIACGGLLVLAAVFLPTVLPKMPDFEVYWNAGARVMSAAPLYRPEDGHFQHKYLPIFAELVAPLALLPLTRAKIIWFYGSVAVVVGLLAISLSLLPHRRLPPQVLVLCTVLGMLKFYAHELNLGQCNALMALCVVVGFACLSRGRPVLAGLVLAMAVVIKPYPVIFLPYLLVKRRLVTFGVFLALVILSLLLPAVIYGAEGNRLLLEGWMQTLSQSTRANLLNQDNVSIWAMCARWFGVGALASGLALAILLAIAAGVLVLLQLGSERPRAEYLEMALLLMLIPLVSPQGWDYELLVATPAIMLLVDEFRGLPLAMHLASGAAMATMALSVFDIMGRRAYAAFMSVSAITFCALVLLGSMACLRVRRLA
jgi:Glycosyltransferase family 87